MSGNVSEHTGEAARPDGRAVGGVRSTPRVDLRDPLEATQARRIARSWIELRRGALVAELRCYLYGDDHVLEQGQMDALDLLVRRDRTMSGLADRLRIDASTATRGVQRLVDHGLVERFPSPDDGRVVMVRVTSEGRARHADVAARRAYAMQQILGAFDPDERALLADLLDRFVTSLDDVVSGLGHATDPVAESA